MDRLIYGPHSDTDFTLRFQKLGNEAVVATLLEYLELYKEYTSENQMKRVVGLLHRIAVKAELHALFYRVSCAVALCGSIVRLRVFG